MKGVWVMIIVLFAFTFCTADPDKNYSQMHTQYNNIYTDSSVNKSGSRMKIIIGTTSFTATLFDNSTSKALREMLPMTIKMSELNANEKYFYFSTKLPVNAVKGGSINSGDIMLYGNNCLVLFYEDLKTSYNYTRLGKVDNTQGLKEALGTGDITVKFELL